MFCPVLVLLPSLIPREMTFNVQEGDKDAIEKFSKRTVKVRRGVDLTH
jgi:hypothetical protein